MQSQALGRWCGVSESVESGHTYFVLNIKGKVISRSTISHLSEDDQLENKERINFFSESI